jgi:hypothetical protein
MEWKRAEDVERNHRKSYRIVSSRVVYINRTIKGSERERGLSGYRVFDRGSGRSSEKRVYEHIETTR